MNQSQPPSNVPPKAVAIHEASHATVGICLGRTGLLLKISVVPTLVMKGGCHWNFPNAQVSGAKALEEAGVNCAGPIGETLFVPEYLGKYAALFSSTIFQPDDVINESGRAGWGSTDLDDFRVRRAKRDRQGLRVYSAIEIAIRALLKRTSVRSAVLAVSNELEINGEILGSAAEKLMAVHLKEEDYVGQE